MGLVKQRRPELLPLSFAQQRLWFLDRLGVGSREYNIPLALRLRGALDTKALEKAINTIVQRHEILRTHFAEVAGEAVQVIEAEVLLALETEDLSGLEQEKQKEEVSLALAQQWQQGFDLQRGPLLRVKLLKLGEVNGEVKGEEEHILLRTFHHIVYDGWSEGVFDWELVELYEAFSRGEKNPLPELPVQYADFTLWQRQWINKEWLAGELEYWKKQLAGVPEALELITDRVRPAVQTFAGGQWRETVSREVTGKLKQWSRKQQATLYMTMLAGLGVLLARYSGQLDIVVGSPIANRQEAELEGLIGFFVNTLVMRVKVDLGKSFAELVAEVKRTALEGYQHQDVPFERLVEELAPQRRLNRTPLSQVVFAYQSALPVDEEEEQGSLKIEGVVGDEIQVRFDLEIHAQEQDGEIRINWMYNHDLFDPWRIQQLAHHYIRVLEQVVEHGARPLRELAMLTKDEEQQLRSWNPTPLNQPLDQPQYTLVDLFEQQVERRGTEPAIVCGNESLSYQELNRRSNQLAHHLREMGVREETAVGICMPRSLAMVVAILGTLKAGGIYLPLDERYPEERLLHMVKDGGATVVVTGPKLKPLWSRAGVRCVDIEADVEEIARRPERNLESRVTGENLAYIIYTSGSTGLPKGTAVPHRSFMGFMCAVDYVTFDEKQVLFQHSAISWDAMALELWPALVHGAKCVLHAGESATANDIQHAIRHAIQSHGVTTLWLTSALFNSIMDSDPHALAGLKQLVIGGEALSPAHIHKALELLPQTKIVNGYGPSECTVFTTCYRILPHPQRRTSIPIGRPIGDRQVFLLDENLTLVPAGVAGEIFVGGPAVARGYVGRPDLTAEKFVPDPFSAELGSRLYRTGDMAWWRNDGNLEFIGRRDQQVKIRGFRIEVGEIEAALQACAEVAQAAVLVREDVPGEKRLVGYVVAKNGQQVDARAMRQKLKRHLPEYMVPATIVRLESLPLTTTGKLDRKALLALEAMGSSEWRGPRSPQEEILCMLFAEVLKLERVGIDDNFFEIGGHSLLATMLASRIRATLRVEMQTRVLFECPTVAQLRPQLRKRGSERMGLVKQQRPERLPLSYAQQRLWFLDRLGAGSREYNVPAGLRLRGKLDHEALEKAINTIVQRHEILRTHFNEIEGEVVQVIAPEVRLPLEIEDISGLEAEKQKEEISLRLAQQWQQGFDLQRGPLLRVKLLKLGEVSGEVNGEVKKEEEHVLLRTFHHIVYDGWSDGVFHWEMVKLYEAFRKGEKNPLPELPVQYADFTLWQRQWMKEEWLAGELEYWKKQLAGIPEALELVTDGARGAMQTFAGGQLRGRVSAEVTTKLKQWSRKQQATLYMTMLAGLGVLLARYSGQEDIGVGSPIANRQEAELEGLIGFFVNTLVMRVKVDARKSFAELVAEVKRTALEGYQHQDVPFERLVEELAPQRRLNRTPMFQVVFAYQSGMPVEEEQVDEEKAKGSLRIEGVEGNEIQVRFDLEIHAQEHDGEIRIDWVYNHDLFAPWRIQQLAHHYQVLLEAVAANSQLEIGNIDLLDVNERKQILEEWNRTQSTYPQSTCLTELIEKHVACSPGAIAVTCQGKSLTGKELTYKQLNDPANQLAHYLVRQGVGPETRVGICVERSFDMVIGLLAIWKAGGAYVPLEPTYPDERLKLIVKDAEIRFLVTTRQFADRFSDQPSLQVIDLDKDWETITQQSPENPQTQQTPDHAAYVIYTSGSTGKPKGVVVTHRNLLNLFHAVDDHLHFNSNDVWTMFHSYAFDFSVWEIWGALISGGRLVIVPYLVARSPEEFCHLVYEEGVTILSQTPSAFRHFMNAHDALNLEKKLKLRAVIFGGEALEFQGLEKWFAQYGDGLPQMINMYGITETTVHTTYHRVTRQNLDESSASLIGGPLANIQIYVLNEYLQPAPVGVLGELYIGGEGVARGYLNLPSLTAERFIPDPFAPTPGSRMYKTGDLARWTRDGNLEFGGRADQQVKIRGFRIELGEIAAVLKQFPEVADAVVIARESKSGDSGDSKVGEKQLLAYVVASPEAKTKIKTKIKIDPAVLRHGLAKVLPDYMVPSAIVELDKLPLTVNGKLDSKALPNPEFQASKDYRAPRTIQEETLCSLFNEVLGHEHVGLDDNFFEIGGHSLLAVRLVARIRATLGVEISIRNLFEAPTVAGLAARMANPILADPYEIILPIRPSGSGLPLFCIHPGLGLSSGYSALIQHIDSSRPIYGVQARGLNDPGPLPATLADMASEYLVHIRELQPHGPYYLLGWSFGGCVAQALAFLLQQLGEEVGLLALLDAFPAQRYQEDEHYVKEYVLGMIAENPDLTMLIRPDQYHRLNEIVSNNIRLQLSPQSLSYSGDAVLVIAATESDEKMLVDLWRPQIQGEIKILSVACGHLEILKPGPAAQIGNFLRKELETSPQSQGLSKSVA